MATLKREFTKEEAASWSAVLDAAITDCGDVVKNADDRQKKIQRLLGIANKAGDKLLFKWLVQLRGKNKDCRECVNDMLSTLKTADVHDPDGAETVIADISDGFSTLKTQRDMYLRSKKRVLDALQDPKSKIEPADYKFLEAEKNAVFKGADESIQDLLNWKPDKNG
jgi:hypothetical protein